MDGISAGVCAALVVIVIMVAVIGHGIWLCVSWLVRGGEPKSPDAPQCPGCNTTLQLRDGHCVECGWPREAAAGMTLSAERAAVERQIKRWQEAGVIDVATCERLLAAMETGRKQPATPAAPPTEAVHPAPPPPLPQTPVSQPAVVHAPVEETFRDAGRTSQQPFPSGATPPPIPPVIEKPVAPTSPAQATAPKPAAADAFRDVEKWEVAPPAPPKAPAAAAAATRGTVLPPIPKLPPAPVRPSVPPPPPPPPRPPRKPFAEVLAAFMEEKHIRWGELIGGLLIIGCSVALVISFWTQIAQFKFYLFTAITAVLFGLGFYSERRWKLPTTSSGVLLIATLLVPLNFLAIAAFSEGTARLDLIAIVRELAALALFAWLVQRAARVLAPMWPALLTAGVLGSSLVQLLVRRLELSGVGVPMLLTLGAATLATYAGPAALMLWRARRWKETGAAEVNALLSLLGVLTFTALLPVGLLVYKTGNAGWALQQLAPLFSLGGTPALAGGLLIWRRVTDARLAGKRMAGTCAVVAGALVMLGGTALAWPQPLSVMPVALADFAVLTAVAWLFEIPAAHLLAVPCLALAYLVGFHAATGHVHWSGEESGRVFEALFSAVSGNALVAMAAWLAAGAAWLARAGRTTHAAFYARATGVIVAASLALVTWFGFGRDGDPHGATWVYTIYAVAALGAAWWTQRASVVWIASALMLAALAQGFVFRFSVDFGWCLALLAHASAAVALVWARPSFAKPMTQSALGGSIVAALLILAGAETATAATSATHTVWLAAVWLAVACLNGWPWLFSAFQAALALAAVFTAVAGIEHRAWFTAASHPWTEPWTIQTIGIALALLSGAWVAVRLAVRRTEIGKKADNLLNPPWPTPDRILSWMLFGLAAALGICGTWPGVLRELDAASAAIAGDAAAWQAHALGFGSWALLGVTWVAMAARLWERFEKRLVLACATGLFIAAWLAAGRWSAEMATASELRWLLAAGLVIGSCFVWFRERLTVVARGFGWPEMESRADGLAASARILWMALGLAPVLLLTLPATISALSGQPIPLPAAESLFARMGAALSYTVPLVIIALVLGGYGVRERSAPWTFASGLAMNLTVSLGWLLAHRAAGGVMDTADWVRLAQFNAATLGGVALAWLGARTTLARRDSAMTLRQPDNLLSIQVNLALIVNGLLLAGAGVLLFFHPAQPGAWVVQCGRIWGWGALVATGAAGVWLARMRSERPGAHSLGAGLLAVASLVAFSAAREDTGGHWVAYHTWLVALASAAWVMVLVNARRGLDADVRWWTHLLGALTVTMALREFGADAGRPWWSVTALVAMGLLAATMAWRTRSSGYLYAGALLFNLAVSVWWTTDRAMNITVDWVRLVQFNGVTTAAVTLAWLAARAGAFRRDSRAEVEFSSTWLKFQIAIGLAANLLLIGPGAVAIAIQPGQTDWMPMAIGGLWGWVNAVLTMAAAAWVGRLTGTGFSAHAVFAGLLAGAALLACSVCQWDKGQWLGYHTLLASCAASAWLAFGAGVWRRDWEPVAARWTAVLGALAVVLALRAFDEDPGRPWWSVGALVSMGLLAATAAWRSDRAGYLIAAGALFNLAVSIWWVTGRPMSASANWVLLAQFNGMVAAGFALAWLGARKAVRRDLAGETQNAAGFFRLETGLALAANLLVVVPAALALVDAPQAPDSAVAAAGGLWGWANASLTLALVMWLSRLRGSSGGAHAVCAGLLGCALLAACTASRWDSGNWLGYHTLMIACAAAAWLAPWAGARRGGGQSARSWSNAIAALVVFLALRCHATDPGRPWWSVGALVAMSGLAASLAVKTNQRGYLYAAGPLLNLATTIWRMTKRQDGGWTDLVEINIVALAVPALAWLAMELRAFSRTAPFQRGLPAFHHVAAIGSALAVAVITAFGLWADATGVPFRADELLGWLALVAAAVLMTACLWDADAAYAVGGLYALGLVAAGMTVNHFHLSPHWLLWGGVMAGGAYTLATSALWYWRSSLMAWAAKFGVPPRAKTSAWLAPANLALAAVVVALAFWVGLSFAELPLRLETATAALAQAIAVGLLAQDERRARLQRIALWLGVIGSVAWGWAWLEPGASFNLLHRIVVVMTAVAAMTAFYGAVLAKLVRRENDWTEAARRMVKPLMALVLATLAVTLVMEILYQVNDGSVPMAWPAILAVTAAILATTFACLVFAVVPGRDPLGLSERGRMFYVYAAEVLVAMVFVHLRLTAPWLFQHHIFERYWPLIIMSIAFLGAGLSEVFRRQNRLVLSEPLERTGAFLPLLPVLGFWLAQPHMHYSVLLLLVGALYTVLSVMRRSFVFGLMAALAANGSLWYLLHRIESCGFWQHPQFWLIPASLSVLVAAWLNRDRLSEQQMTTVRYLASMTLYVSSTADIFINGVSVAPWLPLVLAGLSVAGIFVGMAMRVRAFLYLGASFLVLALLTMIWHAAVNLQQTWVWYVSGIVLGALIIALFAVFEKRRADILGLVDGLKQWEK